MSDNQLLDLELVILNKRIEILKELGAREDLPYGLKPNFLDLMEDKWIFNSVLTSHYSFQEMSTEEREAMIKAALPKKRDRKPKIVDLDE